MGNQDTFTCTIANYSSTSLSYYGNSDGNSWNNGKYTSNYNPNPATTIEAGATVVAFQTESDLTVGTQGYVIYDLGTGQGQLVIMHNNPSTKYGSANCDNCWVYAVIIGPTETLNCYVEVSGFDMQLDPPYNEDSMNVTVSVYDVSSPIVPCPSLNTGENEGVGGLNIIRCYITVLAENNFITLNGLTNGIDPLPNKNAVEPYYGNPPLIVPMIHSNYGQALAFAISGGSFEMYSTSPPTACAGVPYGKISFNLPDCSVLTISYNTSNSNVQNNQFYNVGIDPAPNGAQGYTANATETTTVISGDNYFDIYITIDYDN